MNEGMGDTEGKEKNRACAGHTHTQARKELFTGNNVTDPTKLPRKKSKTCHLRSRCCGIKIATLKQLTLHANWSTDVRFPSLGWLDSRGSTIFTVKTKWYA